MAFQVKTAKRKFILEKGKGKKSEIELKDPHSKMTIEEVINHHSTAHPELATASVDGPKIEGDTAVYRFTTVIGDKG